MKSLADWVPSGEHLKSLVHRPAGSLTWLQTVGQRRGKQGRFAPEQTSSLRSAAGSSWASQGTGFVARSSQGMRWRGQPPTSASGSGLAGGDGGSRVPAGAELDGDDSLPPAELRSRRTAQSLGYLQACTKPRSAATGLQPSCKEEIAFAATNSCLTACNGAPSSRAWFLSSQFPHSERERERDPSSSVPPPAIPGQTLPAWQSAQSNAAHPSWSQPVPAVLGTGAEQDGLHRASPRREGKKSKWDVGTRHVRTRDMHTHTELALGMKRGSRTGRVCCKGYAHKIGVWQREESKGTRKRSSKPSHDTEYTSIMRRVKTCNLWHSPLLPKSQV